MGTLKVRKPKVQEGCQEVTVRKSHQEQKEVGTLKAYVNVDHKKKMGSPLVGHDWHAFCQALYKGIEGEDWEEMYFSYKEMSRAVEMRKPQEGK